MKKIYILFIAIFTLSFYHLNGQDRLANGKDPIVDMIYVEGGIFQMGSDLSIYENEKPKHDVQIESFYMSKYEITQEVWEKIMGTNPSRFQGNNRPVERVSWYDVVKFCNALSEAEGLAPVYLIKGGQIDLLLNSNGYRLPTEAEWEYAAGGGSKKVDYAGFPYPGGYNPENVAWFNDNSQITTHQVGILKPNELGLHDMSGNVYEWCWDWYDSKYYKEKIGSKAYGPMSGEAKVIRGGGWSSKQDFLRITKRRATLSGSVSSNLGFRVVRMK